MRVNHALSAVDERRIVRPPGMEIQFREIERVPKLLLGRSRIARPPMRRMELRVDIAAFRGEINCDASERNVAGERSQQEEKNPVHTVPLSDHDDEAGLLVVRRIAVDEPHPVGLVVGVRILENAEAPVRRRRLLIVSHIRGERLPAHLLRTVNGSVCRNGSH